MKRFLLFLTGALLLFGQQSAWAEEAVRFWFPPHFRATPDKVQKIVGTLNQKSGLHLVPRIAGSFTEILSAMEGPGLEFVYAGSFIQAMVIERQLGQPLLQAVNGKEFYGAVMLFPRGGHPEEILRDHPAALAFAAATSAGEAAARAATGGKAGIRMPHHAAAATAVQEGKAKAAFVKDWWWEANKANYRELEAHTIPGISDRCYPDNVLAASTEVPPATIAAIMAAALASPEAFDALGVVAFDASSMQCAVALHQKAGIEPATYDWSEGESLATR